MTPFASGTRPPAHRLTRRRLAGGALAVAAIALLAPGVLRAQGLRPSDLVRAELRPGWLTPDGTHMAALHLRLADGWKTYWRVPGEAGIAPSFDWTGSRNVASVEVHWPRPEIFDQNGMLGLGYSHELVLPVEITPERAGRRTRVALAVDIGVCRDICVPLTLRVDGALGTGSRSDAVIAEALARRPETADRAGLTGVACSFEPARYGIGLEARIDMPRIGPREIAVIETADRDLWVQQGTTRRSGGTLIARAVIDSASGAPLSIDRSALRLTVISADRVVETTGCAG